MNTLKERAAAKAGRTDAGDPPAEQPAAPAAAPVDELPDLDVDEPGPEGPEQIPVHQAWSRVMGDVRKIAKTELYNAAGTRYNFRGVDRTVNAFAPVLRKHGVLILPIGVTPSYRDTKSSKGNPMRECTVTVRWMVVGPAGDRLPEPLESAGEALDSADKGTAKAQSVALRVLLLTAAMVPTGDPDPDSVVYERGEAPVRSANSYRDELVDPGTSYGRMKQIGQELAAHGLKAALVINENGDEEQLGVLGRRIMEERWPGSTKNGGAR